MSDFVKVTAKREKSEIAVIVADDEWLKLWQLAEELPTDCVWTAQRVEGQGHRSTSAVIPK